MHNEVETQKFASLFFVLSKKTINFALSFEINLFINLIKFYL